MLCRVEQPFRYSSNGISSEWLSTGSLVEIRDDFVAKLEEEGIISIDRQKAKGVDFSPYIERSAKPTLTLKKNQKA